MPDAGHRVLAVDSQGELAIGPGRHEPPGALAAGGDGGEEAVGRLAALVLERHRRHLDPIILGEQPDDAVDVMACEGVGEALHQALLEDWQDPVTSRARQREQAEALVRGHGQIVAEFFDVGESRTVAWARRPQSAALVAQLADPDRGWDAVVIGEYERAFYGSQYAAMRRR